MKKLCLKIAVAMIASIGLFATSASAANRTVNCDEGQSIQDAVERGKGSAAPLYINVSGSCEEVVTITRDDVTIDGSETATVTGTINVDGGRRINISALTITGPGPGVVVGAGYLKLRNVVITGNSGTGVFASLSAYVGVLKSTVSNNDIGGVVATDGASVFVRNTSVIGNDGDGIRLFQGANGTVGKSIINDNSDNGINAFTGTVVIQQNTTISGNANHGIDANFHSTVEIGDSAITNNGVIGIKLEFDSGLITFNNVTITGNGEADVHCTDTESSFLSFSPAAVEVECTDFNQFAP